MLFLLFGFGKVPEPGESEKASTTFSIIVPFRNEAETLPALLSSLKELSYPKDLFQVILVNDASEDSSVNICNDIIADTPEMQVKLVNSLERTGSPKKDAVETGIGVACFDYILTTDADCLVPRDWLLAYNTIIRQTAADMVSGPVAIRNGNSMLSRFQEIDFFSLQTATIGAFGIDNPFMCNGANLCYRKKVFLQVQGFVGNEKIASGDDIFLLEKIKAAGGKTAFLKDPAAIVITKPQDNLHKLFMQRIRWAAKTTAYSSLFPKLIGISVFLMNLSIVAGVLLWIMGVNIKQPLLLAFLVKFNIDFILIYRGAHFFSSEHSMKNYIWASALYPFFCSIVVIFSSFLDFQWKGRKFRM